MGQPFFMGTSYDPADGPASRTGRRCHQLANTDPDTFIHGPKIAGASAAFELCRTLIANPDAMPPFCNPTSMATVRQAVSLNPVRRAPQ